MDVQSPYVRRGGAWLAAGVLLVLIVPGIGGAGRGTKAPTAARLRAHNLRISAERQTVVLRLYALDSGLAKARARIGQVEQQIASVQRERAEVEQQLGIARRSAAHANRRLERHLRLLYERRDVDPLEIILGATSLDDALTALDSLHRTAALDRHVLAQVRAARATLASLDRTLAQREAALSGLRAQVVSTARSLAGARSERAGYLSRLGREQRLTQARIRSIQRRAQLAERKAAALAQRASARAPEAAKDMPAATQTPSPAPAPAPAGATTLDVVATGYSIHGYTATGIPTGWGVTAVDPGTIPLGTRMTVPGYGEAVAADVGSGVQGATIDLWFPTVAQALAWGRRTVTIVLH